MSASNTPAKVLVLARQPMIAALLGMLLELDAYEPAFARAGETPEDALTRIRPLLVILLESDLDAAGSDLFFARAARRGARVVLFDAPDAESRAHLDLLAAARGIPCFRMPIDRQELARTIAAAVGGAAPAPPRVERRRAPQAHTAPDGTLVYSDRAGRRWFVYDRRRSTPAAESYRAFVNEQGEEWRCAVPETDARSPRALERQLARATRVAPPPADDA